MPVTLDATVNQALPTTLLALAVAGAAQCLAGPPLISAFAPYSSETAGGAAATWRAVGLPGGKVPPAELEAVALEGSQVLRLKTHKSYGTWAHPVSPWLPEPDTTLQWRWRVDQALTNADLRHKQGDDAAVKVCLMFDMPLQAVPFLERSVLRMARAVSGEALPAATLCYVWDATLPTGTILSNAYSRRVRFIVADGAGSPLGQWRTHAPKVHADFLRAFGDESETVPPVTAVVVGADADNTGGSSLAYVADLRWGQQ
jgi:hypothetical protein